MMDGFSVVGVLIGVLAVIIGGYSFYEKCKSYYKELER